MEYLTPPVAYLDSSDFDGEGNLTNNHLLSSNLPVFVMIQAVFCGHCTRAKPWFQEFAEKNVGKVICCSIQGDSEMESVKKLSSIIPKMVPDFVGFPTYVIFHRGQKIKYESGRKTENLQNYLDNELRN